LILSWDIACAGLALIPFGKAIRKLLLGTASPYRIDRINVLKFENTKEFSHVCHLAQLRPYKLHRRRIL